MWQWKKCSKYIVAAFVVGCSSSIFLSPLPNITPYEHLVEPGKVTVYGQILNQSRDIHLVIGKKETNYKGKHILADSNGIFAIKLDSGSYELYVDKVGETTPNNILETPPGMGWDPTAKPDGYKKDSYNINYEIYIYGEKPIYIGSYFLMSKYIEINFEKKESDEAMSKKYRGFASNYSIEIYPTRPAKN